MRHVCVVCLCLKRQVKGKKGSSNRFGRVWYLFLAICMCCMRFLRHDLCSPYVDLLACCEQCGGLYARWSSCRTAKAIRRQSQRILSALWSYAASGQASTTAFCATFLSCCSFLTTDPTVPFLAPRHRSIGLYYFTRDASDKTNSRFCC